MKPILNFSSRNPWLILLSLILCTAAFSTRLTDLKVQISAESMAVDDDPAWIAQQKNLSEFGSSNITIILFQSEQLFTTEKLTLIKRAIDELSLIPAISKINSLFSVPNIRIENDNVSTLPFLDSIPDSSEKLHQLLRQVSLNPLVVDNLINSQGTSFAGYLALKDINDTPEFGH